MGTAKTSGTKKILTIIVVSQFCCTSLWFAGNGIMQDLISNFGLNEHALGHLTSAVQFGFIGGTLVFALLSIADRFSPSKVFMVSALLAAFFNLGMSLPGNNILTLVLLRFLVGFFLAGIYPVGMKIAADHFDKGLGKSLGFLVGALVVGTALPHFLKGSTALLSWQYILYATSLLAFVGGLLIYVLVPDGPHRLAAKSLDLTVLAKVFQNKDFRSAAIGYFGHMWELYAFWAFVPLMITTYLSMHQAVSWNVSTVSFYVIAIGGVGCVLSGFLSERFGVKRVANIAILCSGLCCICSPLVFASPYPGLFLAFLLFWGLTVVADSPLFSTMVANNATAAIKGSALTLVNCIGFSITIFSIQLINSLQTQLPAIYLYVVLALGPICGLYAGLRRR